MGSGEKGENKIRLRDLVVNWERKDTKLVQTDKYTIFGAGEGK